MLGNGRSGGVNGSDPGLAVDPRARIRVFDLCSAAFGGIVIAVPVRPPASFYARRTVTRPYTATGGYGAVGFHFNYLPSIRVAVAVP